ncbi:MAG: carbon-nitrogen hydrolase family protein [Deltaproteobacteria bacterium]|nr:carbon-nitrogen hydrolase family protein [Deltaproteobacteria bacterium]
MRLTILELAARWNAPQRVLADVDAALVAKCDTDLVLLPEAALQGYVSPAGDSDLAPFAEPHDGPTARACGALAAKHGVHLVAPLVLREGTALFNAMVCFDAGGEVVFVYRKRHPWLPETWATAGAERPPLVEIAGALVTIAICYDVHFLPTDAAPELAAADVLLFPSAWVEDPDFRLPRLSRLARHYGLTIANANWAPGDVRVPGQGGSCVVGPDGSVVARVEASRVDHVWRR